MEQRDGSRLEFLGTVTPQGLTAVLLLDYPPLAGPLPAPPRLCVPSQSRCTLLPQMTPAPQYLNEFVSSVSGNRAPTKTILSAFLRTLLRTLPPWSFLHMVYLPTQRTGSLKAGQALFSQVPLHCWHWPGHQQ